MFKSNIPEALNILQHTIKGPGFFSPRALGHGEKYTHRFSKAGRFPYLCTLHPTLMRGSVLVR